MSILYALGALALYSNFQIPLPQSDSEKRPPPLENSDFEIPDHFIPYIPYFHPFIRHQEGIPEELLQREQAPAFECQNDLFFDQTLGEGFPRHQRVPSWLVYHAPAQRIPKAIPLTPNVIQLTVKTLKAVSPMLVPPKVLPMRTDGPDDKAPEHSGEFLHSKFPIGPKPSMHGFGGGKGRPFLMNDGFSTFLPLDVAEYSPFQPKRTTIVLNWTRPSSFLSNTMAGIGRSRISPPSWPCPFPLIENRLLEFKWSPSSGCAPRKTTRDGPDHFGTFLSENRPIIKPNWRTVEVVSPKKSHSGGSSSGKMVFLNIEDFA